MYNISNVSNVSVKVVNKIGLKKEKLKYHALALLNPISGFSPGKSPFSAVENFYSL